MMGQGKLNRGASCGNPTNTANTAQFSTAKWSDVHATYRILGASMPSLEGSRDTVSTGNSRLTGVPRAILRTPGGEV